MKIDTRWKLNEGNMIPVVGLGTWQAEGADVEQAVFCALKLGYRHIDTARIYGNEELVGSAIKRAITDLGIARSEIFVTTKLWNADHENVEKAFERSLKLLGLDYVDLYLMHYPVPVRIESWKVMENIKKSGRAKSIGVSNFTTRHLSDLLRVCNVIPAVNQVELTPLLYQKDLIALCKREGILVEAYSPLIRGQRMTDEKFVKIAKIHSKSVAQVLIKWCLQHGLLPLPKSVTPMRIEENLAVFDFELTETDMKILDSMNEGLRLCWDPSNAP